MNLRSECPNTHSLSSFLKTVSMIVSPAITFARSLQHIRGKYFPFHIAQNVVTFGRLSITRNSIFFNYFNPRPGLLKVGAGYRRADQLRRRIRSGPEEFQDREDHRRREGGDGQEDCQRSRSRARVREGCGTLTRAVF